MEENDILKIYNRASVLKRLNVLVKVLKLDPIWAPVVGTETVQIVSTCRIY